MRTARKESASGYYHIMTRGINKLEIFKTYEEKIKIIAYCIMNNHLHLRENGDGTFLLTLERKLFI